MSNKRSAKTCRSVRNTRYLHVNVIWKIYWRSSDRFFYFIFIDHLFKDRLTSKFMRDNSTIWFKNYFHELERRNCLYISSLHYARDIIQILQELNTIYNISTSRTWFTGEPVEINHQVDLNHDDLGKKIGSANFLIIYGTVP